MNYFAFDVKKLLIVISLVIIPLMAVNMEHNPAQRPWFVKPFIFVSGVVQNLYSGFSSGVRGTTALYLNLIDIKKNNQKLQKENAELRAQLGTLTELKLENKRLYNLLGFKEKTKMDLLTAKVIGKDLLIDHTTLTINRGTVHGVKEFMAVITIGGVVGYVIQPQTFTSQILLLTDRYATIDSIVQRSRARGIVEGINNKSCRLSYLGRDDDVQVGDRIVTSGLNNIFPKGFTVGTVTDVVKNQYDISQEVTLKPAVNPFTLEEVFVVLNTHNEDFLTEEETTKDKIEENESKAPTESEKQTKASEVKDL
ncbi:MAG: rod shape-determining protein MreC [Bdellovibrionales bacterium]|nr:rod shape-determining protein MreC [Bdellovibrionales bacterium]